MTTKLDRHETPENAVREPEALKEVHAIRVKIYEETHNLTPEERTAKVKREADAVMEKYGLSHLRV